MSVLKSIYLKFFFNKILFDLLLVLSIIFLIPLLILGSRFELTPTCSSMIVRCVTVLVLPDGVNKVFILLNSSGVYVSFSFSSYDLFNSLRLAAVMKSLKSMADLNSFLNLVPRSKTYLLFF